MAQESSFIQDLKDGGDYVSRPTVLLFVINESTTSGATAIQSSDTLGNISTEEKVICAEFNPRKLFSPISNFIHNFVLRAPSAFKMAGWCRPGNELPFQVPSVCIVNDFTWRSTNVPRLAYKSNLVGVQSNEKQANDFEKV